MSPKSFIWLGLFLGSGLGSAIPLLWGGGVLSISSVIFTAIGGIAGIWLGFKLSKL